MSREIPCLIRAAKLPTFWSKREFGLFPLLPCIVINELYYRGIGFGIGVVASVILFKRMPHRLMFIRLTNTWYP